MTRSRDLIPVGVRISNKGCRNAYTNTECSCPQDQCWVAYARAEHAADRPAPHWEDWIARAGKEDGD